MYFPTHLILESLKNAKKLNPSVLKTLEYLDLQMAKREAQLVLFLRPSVSDLAKELNINITELEDNLKLIVEHSPKSPLQRSKECSRYEYSLETNDGLYYLDNDEIEEMIRTNQFSHPYDPNVVVTDARNKVREIFIFKHIAGESQVQTKVKKELPANFYEWISGFENRYSEQELFLMRWIWEIREKK